MTSDVFLGEGVREDPRPETVVSDEGPEDPNAFLGEDVDHLLGILYVLMSGLDSVSCPVVFR